MGTGRKCSYCGKPEVFPGMVCYYCKKPFVKTYDIYFSGVYANSHKYNPQKIVDILRNNFEISQSDAISAAKGEYFFIYLFEALEEDVACNIATQLDAAGAKASWGSHGYFDDILEYSCPKKPKYRPRKQTITYDTFGASMDRMNGYEFEKYCASLLLKNGFTNIIVTPGSGDQGVDILAEKSFIKYAIQCKNYSSPIGNTCVQEVHAGKNYYNCHVGVVMTNSVFTISAKDLAKATGVLLWDRDVLLEMMSEF